MNASCQVSNRLAVVTTLLASLAGTLSVHAQPQRRGLPAPSETLLPADPVEVDMHRFNQLPIVEVLIDGQGPFRLIVDTGAAGVVLDAAVAGSLDLSSPPGVPPGMQIRMSAPGGQPVPATLLFIEKLTIGAAEFKGIWTVATDLPFGEGMDGIVGLNVFKECLLTYDYPRGRLILQKGSLEEADGRGILDYTTPQHPDSHPVIELELAGASVEFMIDTGMRGWFGLDSDHLESLVALAGPVEGPMGLAVGRKHRTELTRVDTTIGVGRWVVERPVVRLSERNIVGTLFLEHFVVSFDPANRRIRLEGDTETVITPPPLRVLGIQLLQRDGRMVVWDLYPDSHAASVGIAVGDVVHEIDGRPAIDFYGTKSMARQVQNSETVTISYEPVGDGGGGVREAAVRIQEIVR